MKHLAQIKPQRLLDVGCGCGNFTVTLSEFCKSIEAIEPVAGLIEHCQTKNARPNIVYRAMDAVDLVYPDSLFDVVVERGSLHHILDWQKALNEMVRVACRHKEPQTQALEMEYAIKKHIEDNKVFPLRSDLMWPRGRIQ